MSEIPPPEVYLQKEFEASSLKVAQLRGLLLEYQVTVPHGSKKADLVSAFEQHIRPQGAKLLASASKIQPSNSGIISVADDGTESVASTGRKRGRKPKKSVAAQSEAEGDDTGVIQVAPEDVEEIEPPVKKPRAKSRRVSGSEDAQVVIEQTVPKPRGRKVKQVETSSESEVATPAPQSRRSRASMPSASPAISLPSAPSSSRRRSMMPSSVSITSEMQTFDANEKTPIAKKRSEPTISFMDNVKEEDEFKTPKREDSGFSDFNPFQSGSEEAAERERRRRKSSIGLSAKKSVQPRRSEPAPTPRRDVPKSPPATSLRRVGPSRENLKTPPKPILKEAEEQSPVEQYNRHVAEKLQEVTVPDNDIMEITIRQASSNSQSLVKSVDATVESYAPGVSAKSAIPALALLGLLLSLVLNFANQSASIGYCDSSSSTNDIMLNRQSALDTAKSCIAHRTALEVANPGSGQQIHCDVSALPLVPFVPRATSCAPCPQHAICEDGEIIACESEFILEPSVLSILSPALNGLPGLGPRPFPPSCRPDTAKKRMIGSMAKSIESDLAKGRGLVVCARLDKDASPQGPGELYGREEGALRDHYASMRDPKFSREQFEEVFEAALRDLLEHDDVVETITKDGLSYYAATRTELTYACRAKLQAIDTLEQWRLQLASTAAVSMVILYLTQTFKHRKQESVRAEELVQVVLRRLQDQERLHYSDPALNPNAFIPPEQLRDLVLPAKGSTHSRTRLWQRVKDLVEINANVAVSEREVNGEMWKTWEWQGVGERHLTWQDGV